MDSLLEQAGFEPLVPRKAPRVFVVSVLVSRRLFAHVQKRDLGRRRDGFLEDLQAFSIDLVVAGLHKSRHLSGMRQGVI
jgi:hypothetical protein